MMIVWLLLTAAGIFPIRDTPFRVGFREDFFKLTTIDSVMAKAHTTFSKLIYYTGYFTDLYDVQLLDSCCYFRKTNVIIVKDKSFITLIDMCFLIKHDHLYNFFSHTFVLVPIIFCMILLRSHTRWLNAEYIISICLHTWQNPYYMRYQPELPISGREPDG